ncbi:MULTISPECIES: RHS repeat-associated core domain-containing protein [Pseudoalteromonas]|uniref:RHS repeat-associated core domain-containing protein n=1 Tax=Pseudoalteromonas sp. PB2-1 TaxID=2907242 RepID=UPI000A92E6B0|nr:RHS repeat-associated core domain-containing protein [Pseudoalteromonas arabiensis]
MQARYYDPVIGRFMSNDPVDVMGHMGRGNPVHGFGRYTYANNNPYKYVDPDGEFGIQIAATLIGAVIGGATELLTNDNASFSSVARASAVGGAVGLASSLGGGVVSSALLGGGANAAGEAVNQIATGNYDGAKVATAGLTGAVGGALAKSTANSVKGALTKGLPDNSISQASHNMTESTSQRVLSNSQSLTNAGSKSAAADVQVGAGYATGAAAGTATADKVCKDSSGC